VSVSTPYQFAQRGNLFIVPVGPSIDEVSYPTQSFTRPPDYSVWVHGQIHEPGPDLDRARMSPRVYQDVRDDLTRYAPVEVTRSAFRRAGHAYVGVIDSRGTPYYFALDSRGVSVREAPADAAWKAFDRLAVDEHMAGVRQRRTAAADEMRQLDRELSEPLLVVTKGLRYGKKVEWVHDVPYSSWWRKVPKEKKRRQPKQADAAGGGADDAEKAYASEYRRAGHELWLQMGEGDDDPDSPRPDDVAAKALPRKAKTDDVKRTPSRKASKKQAGATGRVRYTYPQEGAGGAGPDYVPLVVVHDDTRHADPGELANQLGVSVRTLRRCARRLGRDGFARFMRSHLKRFAAKHQLDPDYWNTLYANLSASNDVDVAKSDHEAAWKQFGDNVKEAASAVPHGHRERWGDNKVFIHHVHHEMKRHGTYSGSLDEFKDHLVHAHRKGHVTLARADLVGAMNHDSVKHSNTETKVGGITSSTFNFVDNVKHDPEAAKKLEARHHQPQRREPEPEAARPAAQKTKPKVSGGVLREIAHHHSDEANEATAHANKVGTREAHLAAMTAHHHAGVAHQKAGGKVSDKTALRHFDQSMVHLKASKASAA